MLATQQALGSEWLQARGQGIPITTGDPTQTHAQHNNAGAIGPTRVSQIPQARAGQVFTRNQMLGGASLGRFPRPHKDKSCKRSVIQAPMYSLLCSFLSQIISQHKTLAKATHKNKVTSMCISHEYTFKYYTKPKTLQWLALKNS